MKRSHGRDGHPYSSSGKQAGEDQANTFSDIPNQRCPLQSWTSHRWFQCSRPTQAWPWKCKLLNVWVRREINFVSKSPPHCLVVQFWGHLPSCPCATQPWKHQLLSAWELRLSLVKHEQFWKPPSSSSQAAQPKKPLFTTIPNIINQPTVCSDRKLLPTTLILLNKWNHPITHSNLINRSTQRRKWALQNGLEKSSHFVLPFN